MILAEPEPAGGNGPQSERWLLHPQAALHWREIDGQWLVYEDCTGATHMIDHPCASVLTCFESGLVLSMSELIDRLVTDLSLDLSPDLAASAVQQFCSLGLLLPAKRLPALHEAG